MIDPKRDADLRPFDTCPNQEALKDESKATVFLDLHFPKLAEDWSVQFNVTLDVQDVLILMEYCDFNVTLLPNEKLEDSRLYTPICSLFDESHMNLYQIYSDFKMFYTFGYGNSMNSMMMCSLFKGIMNGMKNRISNPDSSPTVYLRFAHAETLVPFITLLGLFEDSLLLDPHLPLSELHKRDWKTWKLSPFSVNIIIELYACDSLLSNQSDFPESSSLLSKEYRILLKLNEEIIAIPSCPYPCLFTDFLESFKAFMNCPFDDICGSLFPSSGSWNDFS